jgi:hypothetical protein
VSVIAAGTKIETRHPTFDKAWHADELVASFDPKTDTFVQTLRKERGEFDGTGGRKSPVHKKRARILIDGHWVLLADL